MLVFLCKQSLFLHKEARSGVSFAQMSLLYLPSPSIEYMMSEQMVQCLREAKPESL